MLASFFSSSRVSNSIYCVAAVGFLICASGCNNQEVQNLKERLDHEKRRTAAFKDDASKAKDDLYAAEAESKRAMQAAEDLRAEVQTLKDKIDEINGVKQLQELGAELKRDENGNVVSFNLMGVESFTNEDIDALKNLKSVREVYMTGPSINVGTYEILAQLPRLKVLEASISGTNTECLEKLVGLKELTYLQLKRTSVTDDSMAVLAKYPKLEQIRVGQTKIGDEGLKHLQNLKTLTALDLTDCNRVSDQGLTYLEDLPRLKMLKVWGKSVTNKGLESIGKMKALEVLGMNDTRIDDEGMFAIGGLTKLKEVYFVRTAVADFGIMQLTGATNMKKMVLRDTNITDEALRFIGKMKQLEILDLSECSSPGPSDNGMEHLLGLQKLKDLNLWSTKIGDAGVAAIAKIKSVVRLNLDATKITDACMADLNKMTQLSWLHIGSTKISEKQIDKLYDLNKLKYLNLSFTEASFSDSVDEIYDKLKESTADGCEIAGL